MASILIVDDNTGTREALRYSLASEGYSVLEATSGKSALAAAALELPDLVVQNLLLPDMDGFELLRLLRALDGGDELPIVALVGFLNDVKGADSEVAEFTAQLRKPIDSRHLLAVVRDYLPGPRTPVVALREGGRRLLVVDDDAVQLKLTRLHFSHAGFEVVAASDAAAAVVAARENRPDVILSDVFMPNVDGFQLCLECRNDPDLATVPIVLLSGRYGSLADQALSRRVGASALVLRTPGFEEAAAAITAALDTHAPSPAEQPTDQLALTHTRLVIHQLETELARQVGLAQRCGVQAVQLSFLTGITDALTHRSNLDVAFERLLAAALDAAGIAKGALLRRDTSGMLTVRQYVGFSKAERWTLRGFFGHGALIEEMVTDRATVVVPSPAVPHRAGEDMLAGAHVTSLQIVPLFFEDRDMGIMVLGATLADLTSEDSVAFGQALGGQVARSLELAKAGW